MFCHAPDYFLTLNKASETFSPDGGAKRLEFSARAFGGEFDAAVGQVANAPGDFKAGGNPLDCVAKANALHAPGIINPQADAVLSGLLDGRLTRHAMMKPNSAEVRNVFCRSKQFCFF